MTATQPPASPGPPLAPTVFAIGIIGLLVVFPAEMAGAPVGLGGLELVAGLFVLALGATLGRTAAPLLAVGWFLASVVGLSAVAIGLWRAHDSLWLGALGLTLAGATLAYGLHRYERVRLGLVETGTEGDS